MFLLATFFTSGIVVQGGYLPDADISATARVVSTMCGGIVKLLAYPAFLVLDMIPNSVPDWLEWAIVALNSLLFGTVAVIIIKALRRRRSGDGLT